MYVVFSFVSYEHCFVLFENCTIALVFGEKSSSCRSGCGVFVFFLYPAVAYGKEQMIIRDVSSVKLLAHSFGDV